MCKFILLLVGILALGNPGLVQATESTTTSLPVILDSLKVEAVTYWRDLLCVARRVDDWYELEIYQKSLSNELVMIFSTREIYGIYHLDGTISRDLLIVYGSSAVATQMSLLRWDEASQKIVDFDDRRFDGDSRLRPEILRRRTGFQLLTFGNINDSGNEPDESKWYAHIYTFEKGNLIDVKKVPFSKRYDSNLKAKPQ